MKTIFVVTPEKAYPVVIGAGQLTELGRHAREALGRSVNAVLVTNPTVGSLYEECAAESLLKAGFKVSIARVQDGERYKNLDTIAELYRGFLEAGLERGDVVVALGGGVVGDLAGFAAATYLRGVNFIQVPTSLLAMVDASIGGKTGVDLPAGKNLVGAFKQPRLVLADPGVLSTLPASEFRGGMAEVVKHGIIGDAELFRTVERGIPEDLTALIEDAVRVKVAIVEDDPLENDKRVFLNLGHTFGHAFELVSEFAIRHGVAVGVGLVAAARLAVELGIGESGVLERIISTLKRQDLPTGLAGFEIDELVSAMRHDKKRLRSKLQFVVPLSIGKVEVVSDPPLEKVERALAEVTKKAGE